VAPDLPSIASPDKVPESSGSWKGPYGERRFTVKPDLTASPIFDGVLAALQAFYLLRAQPDIIRDRLGIVGVSWGGYATTMVSGLLGNAVRSSFSIYGSGYFDRGSAWQATLANLPREEAETWLRDLDAGRRAHRIRAEYFVAAATNDHFFWPPAVMATLAEIPGQKNQLFAPNANHAVPVPGGTNSPTGSTWLDMEADYFAYYLRGEGQPFPVVEAEPVARRGDGGLSLRFRVRSPLSVKVASVYYSTTDKPWEKREWIRIGGIRVAGNRYKAVIPSSLMTHSIDWFALVSDSRPVTVTSVISRLGSWNSRPEQDSHTLQKESR
jgi:dienelactone hydrolase